MGTKVTFDSIDKLMIIEDGITAIDVKTDLYSDAKEDWLSNSTLNKFKFPFRVVGGDETETDRYISPYFFLQYGWKVRPQEADHLLIIEGILLVVGGGDPFVNTLGSYNVRTKFIVPLQATTVTTGSGITEQDKLDIADKVLVSGVALEATAQTLLENQLRDLGLNKENQYIDQTVFDGRKMLSARLRSYSNPSSVGTDSDVIATYQVTATFVGENLEAYKVIKVS